MAVKLVTARGQTVILNPNFRVEGVPVERDAPSVEMTYRDGAVGDPRAMRTLPRHITVSGHFYGASVAECRAQRQVVVQALAAGPVQIYEDEADEQWIDAVFLRDAHSYVPGAGRSAAKVSLQFRADDPRFSGAWITTSHELATPAVLQVTNSGGESVSPVIWVLGPATNPSLANASTGHALVYTGSIADGAILAVDCGRHTARVFAPGQAEYYLHPAHAAGSIDGGTNVIGAMNDEWLITGFEFAPGINSLDVHGTSPLKLQIAYRERWL